jgi:hypothetical protein
MFEGYFVVFICERSEDKRVISLLRSVSGHIKHRWYIFRINVAFVLSDLWNVWRYHVQWVCGLWHSRRKMGQNLWIKGRVILRVSESVKCAVD